MKLPTIVLLTDSNVMKAAAKQVGGEVPDSSDFFFLSGQYLQRACLLFKLPLYVPVLTRYCPIETCLQCKVGLSSSPSRTFSDKGLLSICAITLQTNCQKTESVSSKSRYLGITLRQAKKYPPKSYPIILIVS